MYYVWRRSDGYVAATNGHQPQNHRNTTFEVLLETADWPTARQRIEEERSEPTYPQFSWAVPDLRKTGNSANLTWYRAPGWHVETCCSDLDRRGGKIVKVPPRYHIHVRQLDDNDRFRGEQIEFTHAPEDTAGLGWALPDETVTSLIREHLANREASR